MASSWFDRLLRRPQTDKQSWLHTIVGGSLYRISDIRGASAWADIQSQIKTMRALANDSQISTALAYYATDATTVNTSGQIIWATAKDKKHKEVADIINALFEKWNVNAYARDHILELATVGNLYIPTSDFYKESSKERTTQMKVALDNNTIPSKEFNIVPSTKILPDEILHIWLNGEPKGFIYQPDEKFAELTAYPESAVIHFSLGGMLGDYTVSTTNSEGQKIDYDVQFATPLMSQAVQPTQTLSLLEDALVLSSLTRIVKFINVECGDANEEEIRSSLMDIKDTIEQQFAINTGSGDVQSFVNPQSPNNLIYIPKIKGQDAISVTDLNMAEATEQDSKLLQYYQDKKLSVLGVPKEAMNFSSNEGLGGAGAVMSQRSALYANALQRLETAYIAGWKKAFNTYFLSKNLSSYVDTFDLHMNPIITQQSTLAAERRDAAISQAQQIVELLKAIGIDDDETYQKALTEILSEVLPQTGADAIGWRPNLDDEGGEDIGI